MTDKPFSIIDLIQTAGVDGVKVQFLPSCMIDANWSLEKGATVKFCTDILKPTELMSGSLSHIGVIVWIPRADFERAQRKAADL